MDKGYTTLFDATEKAIGQLQAIMITLQQAQLTAEEIYMQTPSPDNEAENKEVCSMRRKKEKISIYKEKDKKHYFYHKALKPTRTKAIIMMIVAIVLFTVAVVASVIGEQYLRINIMLSLPYAIIALICMPSSLVLFMEIDSMFKACDIQEQEEKEERFQ